MIRYVSALVLLLGASSPASSQTTATTPTWQKMTELYINTGPPRQAAGPVSASTCSWNGTCQQIGLPSGEWHTVDFTAQPWGIPIDAKVVMLVGVLIITHGTTAETADLQLVFRAPGDERVACSASNLIGQAVEASVGNGQRTNLTTWVPLVGGKTQFCWILSTKGLWPTHSSYAVNMSVQAWAR